MVSSGIPTHGGEAMATGYAPNKEDLLGRLRKIEGQVRGLSRMIERDDYCIDVLTQISSAQAALKGVGVRLLDAHVRHCVRDSLREDGGEEKVDELVAAVARMAGR
jgi:CsoR family transcriptional regulator, copper-sensing transcriptional repressor